MFVKKYLKFFLPVFIALFCILMASNSKVSDKAARKVLSSYLREKYGEPFTLRFGGRDGFEVGDRKSYWYEYDIVPESYYSSNKLYDSYYDAKASIEIKETFFGEKFESPGDTYSLILLKESANEFYGKKLKELFGENILPIFEIDCLCDKSKDFMKSVELTKKNNYPLYVDGRIYIFGRVENDEDREWYREQSYKFVEYMKETGTFENVHISLTVVDERIFANGALKYIQSLKEIKDVNKELKPLDKRFKYIPKELVQEKINNLPKEKTYEVLNDYHAYLLSTSIFTPKYIDVDFDFTNKRDLEWIWKYYGGIKEYDKLEDIQFDDELSKRKLEIVEENSEEDIEKYNIYVDDKLDFQVFDYHNSEERKFFKNENGIWVYIVGTPE